MVQWITENYLLPSLRKTKTAGKYEDQQNMVKSLEKVELKCVKKCDI